MNIMKLFKDKKVVIAGPCSFGTYEELDSIIKKLKFLKKFFFLFFIFNSCLCFFVNLCLYK